MLRLVALCVLVAACQSVSLPSNFNKCNRKDADFDKCVLEAARHGIVQVNKPHPELNLPSLNPYELPELSVGAGSQGVVNVEQKFKNCKIFGFDKTDLSEFKFDFDKKTVHAAGVVPEVRKNCAYQLNGKILLLPVVGDGQSVIVMKNAKADILVHFEETQKKDKHYFKFTDVKTTLEPESMSFDFENLFNGDKTLGDNINKVLNENWKDVYQDVRHGYEEALGQVLQGVLNNFFSKVSVEEALD